MSGIGVGIGIGIGLRIGIGIGIGLGVGFGVGVGVGLRFGNSVGLTQGYDFSMDRVSGPMALAAPLADMGQAITDAELVAASRRGEREAFGHLVERYLGLVCAVSYSSTRNQALSEDVAQETFLAAWAQLDELRETSRIRAWLCGIARNLARKARLRSTREEPSLLLDDAPAAWAAPTSTPFEAASAAETERLVWSALDHVPPAYREVLVLYYQQQRSIHEVAQALGLTEDAAMQRLARGRKHLAAQVSDLVERSLEASRPRRGLAAGIIAALPPLGAPGAPTGTIAWPRATTTPASGAKMFKIAMLALAGAGLIGGATYVATRSSASSSTATAAPAATAAPVAATPAPAVPTSEPPIIARAAIGKPPAAPPAPAAAGEECEPPPGDEGGSCDPGAVVVVDDDVPPLDQTTIERSGLYRGPSRGPDDAIVQIAVYQDLECPFCARVLGVIDQLWDEYPGKLRLVVKQFPVHKTAHLSAEATLAAGAQGKYWEMHDLGMAYQGELDRDSLIELARQLKLDVAAFTRALDEHTYAADVARDFDTGRELGVNGTPTFFINGRRFTGAQPIEEFRAAIDAAIAARK